MGNRHQPAVRVPSRQKPPAQVSFASDVFPAASRKPPPPDAGRDVITIASVLNPDGCDVIASLPVRRSREELRLPNFAQELSGRSDGQAVHASAEKVVEVIPIKRQEISGLLAKGGNDYRAIFGGPVDERPIKRQPRGCRNEGGPDNLVPA